MVGLGSGVIEAGLDVCGFQPWISLEDDVGGVTGGKHVKNVFDRQPPSPDDRFAAKNFRIAGNSFEKLVRMLEAECRR